ncbi:uncharacterized protein MELLADRAFT_114115 [Melampsora larici-populina 98AG31]|uniref:Uncharacterized protein n=1 Tax=Melampsora larici-populina (strain 98AG31 / pathotype 3-4-7) TaxID=747676 RepID=F4SC82_MELLP|nr:uncharacterized protein MELLADRAFT_114115 [Melampsora larici-populina 98AG31]EGF97736.1 hypothetical protein MELLADRAFT_114115 [Melampsora larici-populina 98AG31]
MPPSRKPEKIDNRHSKPYDEAQAKVIDYDIAVAYFLEETDHLPIGCIPQSIDRILSDFETLPSITGRQDDLRTCALYIKSTILLYNENPGPIQPFALRYPTLKSLKKLISERSECLRPLPSNKAVVLVALAGRMLAMNLPPKAAQPLADNQMKAKSHMSSEERALMAFEGAAQVNALPCMNDLPNKEVGDGLASANSIQPRLSRAKNKPVSCLGAVYGSLPYEAFGYPLGLNLARADTKMCLGLERQGYTMDDLGEGDSPKSNHLLPQIMGLGEGCVFQRIENARLLPELLWPYEVSRALNAAVNPETYAVAERVTSFIERNSSALLSNRIKTLHNKIIQGPDTRSPPLRISLALYAHAETYAGPARISAARRNRSQFSDPSMWLPFPPPNFSIQTCRKILRKEEESWKKKGRA